MASLSFYLARTDAIRGEYNLAIDRILEVINIRQSLDLSIAVYAIVISTYYNAISEPEAALEWAKLAETECYTSPTIKPRGQLNIAWSLILLDRLDEALEIIDSARELILKSGIEILLAWLSFVTGVYELAQDDIESASKSLEEALEIYEMKGTPDNYLIFLQHLAQLDVLAIASSSGQVVNEVANPWLQFLEDKAIKDNLTGITGKVLLLKAKIAISQDSESELQDIIERLNKLGKHPSMAYLEKELKMFLKSQ